MTTALTPTKFRNIFTPTQSAVFGGVTGTTYEVYDLWGNLVKSGTTGGTLTIAPPGGSWRLGWYRVYIPDSNQSSSFVIIDTTDARFPTPPASLHPYDGGVDPFMANSCPAIHGIFGTGPERVSLTDTSGADSSTGSINSAVGLINEHKNWYFNATYADSSHTREQMVAVSPNLSPYPAFDYLSLKDAGNADCILVFCKDGTINGANVYVGVSAGSTSGYKITVYSPDAVTVVETFDNLSTTIATAEAAVNSSAYIKIFKQNANTPSNVAATAIGHGNYTKVSSAVSTLYTAGARWFEGPWNEPQGARAVQIAHEVKLFSAAVKAGNASAKVLAPNPVSYNQGTIAWLTSFMSYVTASDIDGLSVHAYNCDNGDVKLTRQTLIDLTTAISNAGLSGKALWQTEQGWPYCWYGVQRGRNAVNYYFMFALLAEQYGIPPERNVYWYDVDDGFWPNWLILGRSTQAMTPIGPAFRALTGERLGKTFTSAIDFGTPGNDLYVGNIYTDGSGNQSWAMIGCGEGDGGTIQFTVTGATSLTVLDVYGNTSLIAVASGVATLNLGDTPTYLRVPSGVTCAVKKLDFGTNLAAGATVTPSGGSRVSASRITTAGVWMPYYSNSSSMTDAHAPWQATSNTFPQTVDITLGSAVSANVVVIRSSPVWQAMTSLLDFDVAVSDDGASFKLVGTYTKTPTSKYVSRMTFDSSYQSQAEIFDDERRSWRFVFASQAVKVVRLTIRACTDGGALDDTIAGYMFGNTQGAASNYPTLQSVALYSASYTGVTPSVPGPKWLVQQLPA